MTRARLAEIVGSLSLATEAAAGVAPETAAKAAIIALELAAAFNVSADGRSDLYYAALLRYIGCTSYAHEAADYGAGDDIALMRGMTPADSGNLGSVARHIVQNAGRGASPVQRARSVARLLSAPQVGKQLVVAHCEQAVRLATELRAGPGVIELLAQIYERYDGRGGPAGRTGAQIDPLVRILHVAYCSVLHCGFAGKAGALEVLRERRGGELDPSMVDAFLRHAPALLELALASSVWDRLLDAEPSPRRYVDGKGLLAVAEAFAHFVDVKSPYTLGHSMGVARLCEAALRELGASDQERERGRLAGLLHDLGRASVPNGIWDKPGPLNPLERERVEQHSYQSERVLARSPLFAELAAVVGMHHERLDGSGYHRGLVGAAQDRVARVLAAADVYQALREDRPHRPRHTDAAAADALLAEVRAGKLEREAVNAVLAAAGRRAARIFLPAPAGLSEREVEVLILLARGLTNKQIGKRLFISPRTVGHHVAHIYEKTRVRSRAAAALFAAENQLSGRAR